MTLLTTMDKFSTRPGQRTILPDYGHVEWVCEPIDSMDWRLGEKEQVFGTIDSVMCTWLVTPFDSRYCLNIYTTTGSSY